MKSKSRIILERIIFSKFVFLPNLSFGENYFPNSIFSSNSSFLGRIIFQILFFWRELFFFQIYPLERIMLGEKFAPIERM